MKEPLGSKTIQNHLFFSEIATRIAEGERVRIRAKGNSMVPFIRDGKDEIILEKPSSKSFQKGRLLLVQLNDKAYILHRVKRVDGLQLLLQGDGNLSMVESCSPVDVVAEASAIIRNGIVIETGSFRWNLYRYLWPRNLILRRVGLAVYRRIFF